mgnify:CR=1 FL=1
MEDSRVNTDIGLSFNIRRGRLLIYHSTIRALGNPEYIRFLFNSKDKKVAVQSCEAIDRDSFRVPKPISGEKFQFDISSSPFLSVIYKACGWGLDESYLVYGKLYPNNRLADFELKTAIQIMPDQFVDPENL